MAAGWQRIRTSPRRNTARSPSACCSKAILWVIDRETLRFLAVNEAAVAHYGYTREQFMAMSVAELRPADDRERFKAFIHGLSDDQFIENVGQHIKADGTKIDIAVYSRALTYNGHNARLTVAHDVTKTKLTEAELRRTKIFLDAVILLLFGEKQRGVPKIISGVFVSDRVILPYDRIVVGVIAILMIAAFVLYMQYSKPGRAMRALAQDRIAAQLMGVKVDRYSMIGFALGAMLAGVVGGLLVSITGVNSGIGGPISIKAFLMVMIGGAGVVGGAIAGGFILGMMESVGLTVLREYGDVTYLVIFALLMVFLSIRPNGLMGKPWG